MCDIDIMLHGLLSSGSKEVLPPSKVCCLQESKLSKWSHIFFEQSLERQCRKIKGKDRDLWVLTDFLVVELLLSDIERDEQMAGDHVHY